MNKKQITQAPLFINYSLQPLATSLPLRETPVERVTVNHSACSTIELLATLIGGPNQIETATALLAKYGSLHAMQSATFHDLTCVRGIGKQAAVRILAALQMGLRAATDAVDRKSINCPADAYHYLRPFLEGKEQEYVFVLMLDTRSKVIGAPVEIYHGSLNTAMIRVGEIFQAAIKANAAAIIMAHNHPSGDPSPSPEDIAVTKTIVEAGRLLDITVNDHIVCGANRFVSLRERGVSFS